MSEAQATVLGAFLTFLTVFYVWFATAQYRELVKERSQSGSRQIAVASSGTVFIPAFDPFVGSGSEVFLAAGDGLYHTRNTARKNRIYQRALEEWLARGATLRVILSRVPSSTVPYWEHLKRAFPERMHIYALDRYKVSGPESDNTRATIASLDTYHANIVLNPSTSASAPGAMWIETNHPIGSRFAYGIEIVEPQDAKNDDRLQRFATLYRQLLSAEFAVEICVANDHQRIAA